MKTPAGESWWRDLLDKRRAYELYKLLRSMNPAFVPGEFSGRSIACVNDLAVDELDIFLAMIDGLRGVEAVEIEVEEKKKEVPYRTHTEAKYAYAEALCNRVLAAYDEGFATHTPKVKTALKGVKAKALNKALRYIAQRFLKHIFLELRKAAGLSEHPPGARAAA
jgi:hypothetical protein